MLMLALIVLMMMSTHAIAQPIKPAYNIGDYEYLIGGYDGPSPSDPDSIWPFMDSMGVTIPFISHLFPFTNGSLAVLKDTSDQWWRTGRRFLPLGSPLLLLAGFGREIQFYPFDSVQSTLWPCKFITKANDATAFNATEEDPVTHMTPREAIYENSGTIGSIASTIALNAASLSTERIKKNRLMLSGQHTGEDPSRCGYFVVTGHLFDSLNANNNDAVEVFRVAIYHQLDKKQHYLRDNLTIDSAGANGLDILVDSFAVTRGELRAGPSTWLPEHYREISHRTDLYWRPYDNGPGPLHPSQPNGREQALDIRVYWTGAEKAALRSVAYRDSLGERVLGTSQHSSDFRDSIVREARTILQGSPTAAPTDPIHPAIFRLESGHENHVTAYAGYIAMDRLIRETFNKSPHTSARDSVPVLNVKDNPNAPWFELSDQREHTVETYFNNSFDVDSMFGNMVLWKPMSNLFNTPHEAVPAIGEHNGGRFTIPEMNVSDTGIENYETSIQRMILGRAFAWQLTGDDQFPFSGNALSHLSEGATICRDRKIRMIQYVGTVRRVDFRRNAPLNPADTLMDTVMSHVPEAAELRAMANIGLAWNAKGIVWWNFGDCKITNIDSGVRFEKC